MLRSPVPPGSFGPRLQAAIGYLAGRIGASQRDAEEVLATFFHTDLGLGSISTQEDYVSSALAEPVLWKGPEPSMCLGSMEIRGSLRKR